MRNQKVYGTKKGGGNGLVAVAIDKDKGSQHALKWALDNLLTKGRTVVLVHVFHKNSSYVASQGVHCNVDSMGKPQREKLAKNLFLPFHCYCIRKEVQCLDVVLHDHDVAKALADYASYAAFENLVLGASSHMGFIRKFRTDVTSTVSKAAPDFCNVYIISKGKVSSVRSASRPAPFASPLLDQIQNMSNQNESLFDTKSIHSASTRAEKPVVNGPPRVSIDQFRLPLIRPERDIPFAKYIEPESDISFVSSDRPSIESTDRASSITLEFTDPGQMSTASTSSFGSMRSGPKSTDLSLVQDFSTISHDSARTSCSNSSQGMEDLEAEMRRLKLELKQTMEMYSTACREALTAKQKAMELNHWRIGEEQRLEEAKISEEEALLAAERERSRCMAAAEEADAARKMAELESRKRLNFELKAVKEMEEMRRVMDGLAQHNVRYRRYTIEEIEEATEHFAESRKVGEGGYGPVYRCTLDHTPVAVKILRPDAAQGRSQFQREVEVLSLIRHPNMLLLLGACPEYGILVYEYMARGSLEDRLFRKGNTPILSWQLRFRIAAEIATGLLFLHQTKPEPLVHRDLKPGNILLDSNYVSKISDVGLARLVPAVAENVTQYHVTSAAGTFCYIDPEYQQTGMLGTKSDVYSLGIILLQIITAKPPMGLTYHVENAIENGAFREILDPGVPDWPEEEALAFAKLGLQCAELRRKDRPDLGKVVLPELNRLRDFAEEKMSHFCFASSTGPSPNQSHASISQEVIRDSQVGNSASSASQIEGQADPEEES